MRAINSRILWKIGFFLVCLIEACVCEMETCDRRPFDTQTEALPPDNRFFIDIDGVKDLYKPGGQYTVRLRSRDSKTTFIGYTIGLRESETYNEKNPRKPKKLSPGTLQPSPDSVEGKTRPHCNNTVIQSDITPKTEVKALWIAPGKGNECVTIYAIVAIKPDVWYNFDGPLSKHVCEDNRNPDDILPTQNDDCRVCEEARYLLTFQGLWSYNTHPEMFPNSRELARFSEVVGASHSKYFSVYKFNTEATPGMKMLAEQGNTTQLELEIQEKLGNGVRTVIKATAPFKTYLSTVTSFRVNKDNHLVSLVTGIIPSPDWFLGMSNLELCDVKTNKWAKSVKLNLYPLDAGTDSGKTFESSNDETSPPQPINTAEIVLDGKTKAFARIKVDLIRTYPNSGCTPDLSSTTDYESGEPGEPEESDGDDNSEENEYDLNRRRTTSTTPASEEPVSQDPESSEECPMTSWENWDCEGPCDNDGVIRGLRIKQRFHIVDGIVVGRYSETPVEEPEVPKHCLREETISTEYCEQECGVENQTEADAEK